MAGPVAMALTLVGADAASVHAAFGALLGIRWLQAGPLARFPPAHGRAGGDDSRTLRDGRCPRTAWLPQAAYAPARVRPGGPRGRGGRGVRDSARGRLARVPRDDGERRPARSG